jgi:hypothetical protein
VRIKVNLRTLSSAANVVTVIRGSIPGRNADFSLRHLFQTGCGTHPAGCPVGTAGPSLGIRRLLRETGHSRPSDAEVKNTCFHCSVPVHDVLLKLSTVASFTSYFTPGEKWRLSTELRWSDTSYYSNGATEGFLASFRIEHRIGIVHSV